MAYEITGFMKHSELDNWENGCSLSGGRTFFIDYKITADTIEQLKEKILSFVGTNEDYMDINACNEDGRIDIQKTENDEGYDPTKRELEKWKSGEIDLWAVTYTCIVESVTRKIIKL